MMDRRHEFLTRQKIMRLATVSGDGTPHVVPVWYMYRDHAVYIGTNTRTTKARNICRTNNASFCVDEGIHAPLYGVMGSGPARLIKDDIDDLARQILLRYFDTMQDESAIELLNDTDCIIEIKIDRLVAWY